MSRDNFYICPRCGTDITKVVEETEVLEFKPSKEDLERGVDPDHRWKLPGAKTRRVEPCGCELEPPEWDALLAQIAEARK